MCVYYVCYLQSAFAFWFFYVLHEQRYGKQFFVSLKWKKN